MALSTSSSSSEGRGGRVRRLRRKRRRRSAVRPAPGSPFPPNLDLLAALRGCNLKTRIVHRVIIPREGATFAQLLREAKDRFDTQINFKHPQSSQFVLLASHVTGSDGDIHPSCKSGATNQHLHHVHACGWHQRRCGDVWSKEYKYGTFTQRTIAQSSVRFGDAHFVSLLCYLALSKGRRIERLSIAPYVYAPGSGSSSGDHRHSIIQLIKRYCEPKPLSGPSKPVEAQNLEIKTTSVQGVQTGTDTRGHAAVGHSDHHEPSESRGNDPRVQRRSVRNAEQSAGEEVPGMSGKSALDVLMDTARIAEGRHVTPRDTPRQPPTLSLEHLRMKIRKSQGTDRAIAALVENFLCTFMPVPASNLRSLKQWQNDPDLRTLPLHSKAVHDAVDRYSRSLAHSTLKGRYKQMTDDSNYPVWASKFGDIDCFYAPLGESTVMLEDVLLFQFGSENKVKEFLQISADWFDCKFPKQNTIVLTSSPNGGKTWIASVFAAVSLNPGYVQPICRSNAFPLQDAIHKSLLILDEFSYTLEFTETLKLLLAGSPTPISVKWEKDTILPRIPILILSNRDDVLDMTDDLWKCRVFHYKWKRCELLKDFTRQCHPLSYFSLLNKYNINF